jgi:Phage uncharacterised protein (Phage_XkdX).
MTYDVIKNNFDKRLWNTDMVKTAVSKGVITQDQYQDITGEEFPSSKTGLNIIKNLRNK